MCGSFAALQVWAFAEKPRASQSSWAALSRGWLKTLTSQLDWRHYLVEIACAHVLYGRLSTHAQTADLKCVAETSCHSLRGLDKGLRRSTMKLGALCVFCVRTARSLPSPVCTQQRTRVVDGCQRLDQAGRSVRSWSQFCVHGGHRVLATSIYLEVIA
eukprot:TRINITY_DN80570_c0_g1_i1.p3 TRINITY_DN80570_c0_g1~~TRINITY_DN80570_c0_g1_i1.p3  ORF type:complete len:158 (+),score=13.73 TRINITY_DN80570_c0_g1_i1:1043-1516(+)